MASDIAPNASENEIARPPPQWSLPDDDPNAASNQTAWNTWNDIQEKKDEEFTPRDPQAETQFWRSAARDLNIDDAPAESGPVSASVPPEFKETTQPNSSVPDIEGGPSSTSENVWGMARGVTGEMTSLQNRLRDELEDYDPNQNKDQYRDVARELVGPENDEPWEDKDPVRVSEQLDPGSGWNPDYDWMRFDDVGRDKVLADEAAKRRAIEDAARETMESALDEDDDTVKDLNEWETLTDQRPADFSTTGASTSGQVPGFIANRGRPEGTYGDGWSGSKQEIQNLQEQGVELRDPKSDAEAWRSIARELDIQADDQVEEAPKEDTIEETKSVTQAESESDSDTDSNDPVSANKTGNSDEDSWSRWRTVNSTWEQANEKVEERDPRKEVNMWMDSARELAASAETPTIENLEQPTFTTTNSPDLSNETSVWEQWRSSNANWERSVEKNEKEWAKGGANLSSEWSSSEDKKVDWGAGLGKTNSERSAWDNWNRVAGQEKGTDANMWWKNRLDGANDVKWEKNDAPLSSFPDQTSDTVSGMREDRLEDDLSVNSWRSMAKELTTDDEDVDADGK